MSNDVWNQRNPNVTRIFIWLWFLCSVPNLKMKLYLLFYIFLKLLSVSSADSEDSALAEPDSKVFYNTGNIFNITGKWELQVLFSIDKLTRAVLGVCPDTSQPPHFYNYWKVARPFLWAIALTKQASKRTKTEVRI